MRSCSTSAGCSTLLRVAAGVLALFVLQLHLPTAAAAEGVAHEHVHAAAAAAAATGSRLRFSRALGSHMVLQQAPARATIWGFGAPPGGQVAVTLRALAAGAGGQGRLVANATATAGADGSFAALLPPQPAGPRGSPTAHVVRAALAGGSSTVATEIVDVLFGEVWLCGG